MCSQALYCFVLNRGGMLDRCKCDVFHNPLYSTKTCSRFVVLVPSFVDGNIWLIPVCITSMVHIVYVLAETSEYARNSSYSYVTPYYTYYYAHTTEYGTGENEAEFLIIEEYPFL